MPLKTTRFDTLDHLKTPEERVAYLDAAFEEGDPGNLRDGWSADSA